MTRLKTAVAVLDEAQPVVRALESLHVDIGSISAKSLYRGDPPEEIADVRWLCVALADRSEVRPLADRLFEQLHGDARAITLTNQVLLHPLPLDAVLIVFLEIPALEVAP